jgi:hypothetical protein
MVIPSPNADATQPESPASQRRALRMPDFAGGTHAHLHTLHSALDSLAALGVSPSRIMLRRRGRSADAPGTILGQHPAPGEPLTPATMVELSIAGLGFTHALPVGMWDSGGEAAAGTREILEPFDDPLEKLKHWFHEGAPLFRISAEDPAACARWLTLFGVEAGDWPRSLWFRLASLISRMAQLSCSESGWAFVLEALLGLPVQSFTREPNEATLAAEALSGLGSRSSRLGVDLLMGDRADDIARLRIELGPVPLPTYEHFVESREGQRLLAQTMTLLMPCSQPYEIAWAVHDKTRPPQLGVAAGNSRLGINTHMGKALSADTTFTSVETASAARSPA